MESIKINVMQKQLKANDAIARGERRDVIFTCPADKEKFLIKLGETTEKYRLLVHAFV